LEYREHLRNFTSLVDEIKDLGIPSHVVYGENDDVWPLNEQQDMAHKLGARLTVLPGCGHCPNEENPSLTADALSQFWKSIQ
jgi:pimeloyl-ACP methyl ester carboxylesterase